MCYSFYDFEQVGFMLADVLCILPLKLVKLAKQLSSESWDDVDLSFSSDVGVNDLVVI